MFGNLKKKLSSVVDKFKKKKDTEPKKEKRKKKQKKPGLAEKVKKKVTEKKIKPGEMDEFLEQLKLALMENDVALEVTDKIADDVRKELTGKSVRRGNVEEEVRKTLRKAMLDVLSQETMNITKLDDKSVVVFVGFNGCGKTTTIAKVAKLLQKNGKEPVLAAADTFRTAAIEQLGVHADNLDCKIVKHKYGSDAAAVVFDARKYVESKGGIVLADTAGRSHADTDLMNELEKIIRVNKPDLKVLVVDSLTGNDAVEQAKSFDKSVGVDAVVLTKADVNEKGGAALSVGYVIGKPILFLGTGQDYEDLEVFEPEKIVRKLI